MIIAFVCIGDYASHPTLKRATGMAGPLKDAGCEVHLLLQDTPVNREKVTLECPSVLVHWYDGEARALTERKIKQAMLNRIKPDVVWICGVGLRNWMRKSSKKTVLIADHSELYSQVSSSKCRRFIYSMLEWAYCCAFDRQICASRYLESFYEKRLKRLGKNTGVVHYSPYAFHRDVIKIDEVSSLRILEEYGQKKVILYMGTFSENYGIHDLVEAVRRLGQKRDDFVLLLIGKGREESRVRETIAEHKMGGVVDLLGYVHEESLGAYFSTASIFICPLRDTVQDRARCPSKLFFYLPYLKPVVTCKIGEAANLYGDNGFYYEPNNISSMEKAIDHALNSDAQELPDPSSHDWQARADAFLTWYSNSIDDGK